MPDKESDSILDKTPDLQEELQELNKKLVSSRGISTHRSLDKVYWLKKDGTWSWIACFCAVMNQLLIFGILNVYTLFLIKFIKEFNSTTSEAAWLGSLTLGLMKLFAPLSSSLATHCGNRLIMMTGCLFCTLALLGSSFAPNFQSLFGTLCVPYALGAAFAITPSMMVPIDYFKKHQGVAMGIVAAGSSVGTLILAPLVQFLLDTVNWRATFRIFSIFFGSLVFLNTLVKPRKRQTTLDYMKKPVFRTMVEDLALWKNRVFAIWALSLVIVYFGYQIPNILLASYAEYIGINAKTASYIIMGMGAATTVSRLVTGKLMTCTLLSRLHFKQTIFILMGTVYLLLVNVKTTVGLSLFAVARGLLDGAHIVMLPMLTSSMVGSGKALLGWGYLGGAISVTYSLGSPLAGLVKDKTGSYDIPCIMAGLPLIIAGLLLFWLPWAQRTGKTTNVLAAVSEMVAPDPPSSFVEATPAISMKSFGVQSRIFPSRQFLMSTADVRDGGAKHRRATQKGSPRPLAASSRSLPAAAGGSKEVLQLQRPAIKTESEPLIHMSGLNLKTPTADIVEPPGTTAPQRASESPF